MLLSWLILFIKLGIQGMLMRGTCLLQSLVRSELPLPSPGHQTRSRYYRILHNHSYKKSIEQTWQYIKHELKE